VPIRWKLALLLLLVALLPLLVVGGIQLASLFRFGVHLADHERRILTQKAHEQLVGIKNDYAGRMALRREVLRMLLLRERERLEQALAAGRPPAALVERVGHDVRQLIASTPLAAPLEPVRARLRLLTPADRLLPSAGERWFLSTNGSSAPEVGLAMPLQRPGGVPVGVLQLSVAPDVWFFPVAVPDSWAGHARQLLLRPVGDGAGDGRFPIVARWDSSQKRWIWNADEAAIVRRPLPEKVSVVPEEARRSMFLVDGVATHWLQLASGMDGLLSVLLVPHRAVVAAADQVREHARSELASGLRNLAGGTVLVALVILLLAVRLSRRFTAPILELARVAEQIAGGEYSARTNLTSRDEVGELARVLNALGPRLADRERMMRDLSAARKIQEHLWPRSVPSLPAGGTIAGSSRPCEETGGDYYDFIPLGDGGTGLVVGDVTGHGLAAALLMASGRSSLRALVASGNSDLGTLFLRLNQAFLRDAGDDRFMSLFLAVFYPENGLLRWNSAGQAPVFICRNDGSGLLELEPSGPPLGISDRVRYEEPPPVQLQAGDLLVAATDGIWEGRNVEGSPFGLERLRNLILRHRRLTAPELLERIFAEVGDFCRGRPPEDDLTLVILKAGGRPNEVSGADTQAVGRFS